MTFLLFMLGYVLPICLVWFIAVDYLDQRFVKPWIERRIAACQPRASVEKETNPK